MKKKLTVEGFENADVKVVKDMVVIGFAVDDGDCAADFEFSRTFSGNAAAKKFYQSMKKKMTEKEFNKILDNGFEEFYC